MDSADGALLDVIYDAAVEPELWPRLLEQLADKVGGASAALLCQNQLDRKGRAITARLDPAVAPTYFASFAKSHGRREARDPQSRLKRFVPHIVSNEDQYPVLARSELYNELMRPLDIHSIVRVGLAADGLDATLLAITRPQRSGGFEPADLAPLERLHPHLIRAYGLGQKLSHANRLNGGLAEGFERARDGLFLLDDAGKVLTFNPAAEAIIADRDGGVAVVAGRLLVDHPPDGARLEAIVRGAARGDGARRAGGSMALPRGLGRRPWAVSVAPVRAGRFETVYGGPSVIVSITDLDAGAGLPAERLRALFGLTPAEVKVALRLFEGESPREAAVGLGLSFYTVRSHLLKILDKTGAKRQAELMRIMMRIAGVGMNVW
jgi:DNA-binding CsgD family transcriptional regulator/PAS domain-containing protein